MSPDGLEEALNSEHPLRGMWDALRDSEATRFTLEFMALASHNDVIRDEIARNAAAVRAIEAEAVARHLEPRGIRPRLSPQVVSILTNAVARLLIQESTLGIDVGHDEMEPSSTHRSRRRVHWFQSNRAYRIDRAQRAWL